MVKNYRPISLLPVLDKIFEKVIHDSLYNYFTANQIITSVQSGFRKGDSCVSQLLAIVHNIHKDLDNMPSHDTRGIFLDMSKAFDKVWHKGLIFKLDGKLLSLLEDYLSTRQQRILINGKSFKWNSISAGVPYGSVLGPLLFLIYINDLPEGIKSSPHLFADDVSLYCEVADQTESTQILNKGLLLIQKWSFQWKMQFNPDINKQATEIYFTNKNNVRNILPLSFNNKEVNKENSHKHLDLFLDENLTFERQISDKISKATKGIGVIKYLYPILPRNSSLNICKSFVRPHLDYCYHNLVMTIILI